MTEGGERFQALVLELFRLNGELARHGAALTAPFGQSQARWQVLGAACEETRTVPQIARRMGLTRQSVQRVANLLVDEGLLTLGDNPDHERSPLLLPTEEGLTLERALKEAGDQWADAIADGVDVEALEGTLALVSDLMERLDRIDPTGIG